MIRLADGEKNLEFVLVGSRREPMEKKDYAKDALEIFTFFRNRLPSGTYDILKLMLLHAESKEDAKMITLLRDPTDLKKLKGLLRV